ncbi:hypothetical protein PanWU01x14_254030, partial [Parasponia andersonii]
HFPTPLVERNLRSPILWPEVDGKVAGGRLFCSSSGDETSMGSIFSDAKFISSGGATQLC